MTRRALVVLLAVAGGGRAAHAEDAANLKDADAPAPKKVSATEVPVERTTEMCIDQEIADRLAIKRKRRGAVDRLFVKQGRHEITLAGGYYESDLFSGTYIVGGAYTYHMTDETAVEFAGCVDPRQRRHHPRARGPAAASS